MPSCHYQRFNVYHHPINFDIVQHEVMFRPIQVAAEALQMHASLSVLSAVCNRHTQQDLIHTEHGHSAGALISGCVQSRKADKIVDLGLSDKVASGRPWQVVAGNLQR